MVYYFLPRMLSAVITILILIVLTRVLGPADFGRYSMTILIGSVGFAFTFAWLSASIPRFHHAQAFEGRSTSSILGIAAILAVILIPLIALSFTLQWEVLTLLSLGGAYAVAHATHEIGLAGLRVLQAGPQYAAVTLLRHAFSVGLAILFVNIGWGFEGAVWGFVIGAAGTGSAALWYIYRRTGAGLPSAPMLKEFLTYGKPLAVVTSISSFFLLASQTLLASLQGLEAVGYFAAAQTLAMRSIRMPMANLSRVAAASIFKAYENTGEAAADGQMNRHFSFLILFVLPIATLLVFADQTISSLVFADDFTTEVARNLQLLAIAAFLLGMQGAYFSYAFTLARRTTLQLFVTLGTLAFHAAASWVCITIWGDLGASIGFIVSAIVSLGAYYIVGKSVYREILPMGELARALVGLAVLAPFAIYADTIDAPLQSLGILAAGAFAYLIALMIVGQTAARMIWTRLIGFVR